MEAILQNILIHITEKLITLKTNACLISRQDFRREF